MEDGRGTQHRGKTANAQAWQRKAIAEVEGSAREPAFQRALPARLGLAGQHREAS